MLARLLAVTAVFTAGATWLTVGTASAGAALTVGTVVQGAVPGNTKHKFDRTQQTVHVFAAVGPTLEHSPSLDMNLTLRKGATELASSKFDKDNVDFVVVDARPGRFSSRNLEATVDAVQPEPDQPVASRYWIEVATATRPLTLPPVTHHSPPKPADVIDLMIDMRKLVDVYTIKLNKGDQFWVSRTDGMVSLVESAAADPKTWVQNRSTAQKGMVVVDGCQLITVRSTGTHALVIANHYGIHDIEVYTGRVLARADPSKLTKCPIKNWPPTP
jgi:hypothetical protein